MNRIKTFVFGAVILFSSFYAGAVSVAFQIVQRDSSGSDIRNSSYLIEEGLFDYFFNAGVIVSNSPCVNSADGKSDADLFKKSIYEAGEGGVQYFVEIVSEYDYSESTNPEAALLENIKSVSWTVRSVATGQALGSGKGVPPRADKVKNAQKGISDFSKRLAAEIFKVIRR